MDKYQRHREKLRQLGLCQICGKPPLPGSGKQYCEECLGKRKVRKTRWLRVKRDELVASGLCIACGENPRGETQRCMVCSFKYNLGQSHYRSLKKGVPVHKLDVVFELVKPLVKTKQRKRTRLSRLSGGSHHAGGEGFKAVNVLEGYEPELLGPDFEPTTSVPGSVDKVTVLEDRYAAGLPLWHIEDKEDQLVRDVDST